MVICNVLQVDEEEKPKEELKEDESENQAEEDPLDPDILDHFTATRLVPGCMKLLDSLPDTVYRVCDLLVAVVHRNGSEWRDKMIYTLMAEVRILYNGVADCPPFIFLLQIMHFNWSRLRYKKS